MDMDYDEYNKARHEFLYNYQCVFPKERILRVMREIEIGEYDDELYDLGYELEGVIRKMIEYTRKYFKLTENMHK